MNEIKVPEGMLKAAEDAVQLKSGTRVLSWGQQDGIPIALTAALRWLSENPIVPTDEQVAEMRSKLVPVHPHWANIVCEWQRRMFLVPDPDEPIRDLLKKVGVISPQDLIREAYRRGQQHPNSDTKG